MTQKLSTAQQVEVAQLYLLNKEMSLPSLARHFGKLWNIQGGLSPTAIRKALERCQVPIRHREEQRELTQSSQSYRDTMKVSWVQRRKDYPFAK